MKEYKPRQFERWFGRVRREFAPVAKQFAGKPIVYVEIGTWAGTSAEWVCKNILTHSESKGFGIDPYVQSEAWRIHDVAGIKAEAADRVRVALGDRWAWIYERSYVGLKTLGPLLNGKPIDLFYIDGIHEAHGVLHDFVLGWPLLRIGSVVIFDDHFKRNAISFPHVREAVEAISIAFRGLVEVHVGRRQAWLKVLHKEEPEVLSRRRGGKCLYLGA